MTHACELENFGGKILEDSGNVDGSLGANTHLVLGVRLEETLDTTAGELGLVAVSNQLKRHATMKDSMQHVMSSRESRSMPCTRSGAEPCCVDPRCDAKSAGAVPEKSDRAGGSRIIGAWSVRTSRAWR